MMGVSVPRRNHAIIVILTLSIGFLLFWRLQINGQINLSKPKREPILMKDLEGLSFKLPADPARNSGVAFATAIKKDSEWAALEILIQSIQSYIVNGKENSSIYVFYGKELSKAGISRIRTLSLVKGISMESLPSVDPKRNEHFVSAMVLEYLLVEHPVVVFIETGHFLGDKAISQVLKGVAKYGEIIVPGADFVERSKKLNPGHPLKTSLPMCAYSRSSFIERVRPHLECQRGGSCDESARLSPPKSQSVLKRGFIGLRKADDRIMSRQSMQTKWYTSPLTEELFESLYPVTEETLRLTSSRIVGIAIELEGGNFDKFKKLLLAMKHNDLSNTLFVVYLFFSGVVKKDEILNMVSDASSANVVVKVAKERMIGTLYWNKNMTPMVALKDGCSQFYHFSSEEELPTYKDNWLKQLIEFGNTINSSQLIITTAISGNDQIWMLKELVGSIHGALTERGLSPAPKIIVLGNRLSSGHVEMIKLWQFVEYIDISTLLVGSRIDIEFSFESFPVRIMALESLCRRDGFVLWISPKIALNGTGTLTLEKIRKRLLSTGQILVEMDIEGRREVVIEGYLEESFTTRYGPVIESIRKGKDISPSLKESLRDYAKAESGVTEYNLVSLLPKPSEDKRSQNYCHLTLRPEIMYNFLAFPQSRISRWGNGDADYNTLKMTSKTKIAFLVPSKNKVGAKPSEIPLIQNFLKTLIKSISDKEWDSFQYSIYVGYDRDDSVLDKRRQELQELINTTLGPRKNSLIFKYHLLPTAKCITLLWNILFTDAYNDGNDYFYQINDDVAFESSGWSSSFVKKLRSSNDFGVVGPNDRLWQCRLLTQSFVSRKHFDIFGWYFPTEIKDWYSDNWITNVYGSGTTFCDSRSFIRNSNTATRYNVCSQPHWQEALLDGQRTIAAWLHENDKKLLEEWKSQNSTINTL